MNNRQVETRDIKWIVKQAFGQGFAIPAFNIPYLPMMAPVVNALRDAGSFGLIMVARLEWKKFESQSLEAVAEEYQRVKNVSHTRLHLDHVPVIDEDGQRVDALGILKRALTAGYESVMIDGSRLPLDENIEATTAAVHLAHRYGVAIEGELGAVLGHEKGPLPSYEELFASGRGFTDPEEARRFAVETGVDWLSVAIGNIHGAIEGVKKDQAKVQARLDLGHLQKISSVCDIPLVLHGGSGITRADIAVSQQRGIAKINVATSIRQPYERLRHRSIAEAQDAVYRATLDVLQNELQVAGTLARLMAGQAVAH